MADFQFTLGYKSVNISFTMFGDRIPSLSIQFIYEVLIKGDGNVESKRSLNAGPYQIIQSATNLIKIV